jgi:hypothetical protein
VHSNEGIVSCSGQDSGAKELLGDLGRGLVWHLERDVVISMPDDKRRFWCVLPCKRGPLGGSAAKGSVCRFIGHVVLCGETH